MDAQDVADISSLYESWSKRRPHFYDDVIEKDSNSVESGISFQKGHVVRYAGLLQQSAKECDAGFAIDPFGLRSCAVVFIEFGNYPRAEDYLHIDHKTDWTNALSIHLLAMHARLSDPL